MLCLQVLDEGIVGGELNVGLQASKELSSAACSKQAVPGLRRAGLPRFSWAPDSYLSNACLLFSLFYCCILTSKSNNNVLSAIRILNLRFLSQRQAFCSVPSTHSWSGGFIVPSAWPLKLLGLEELPLTSTQSLRNKFECCGTVAAKIL